MATAASYVVSPGALGPVAVDPSREADRLSASYLIALGARVVREVGDLVRRAEGGGQAPGDPRGGIPRSASGRRRTGRLSATNSPKPSRNSFRSITMNLPPAAARIAWWLWRTLCRKKPDPKEPS